MVQSAAGKTLSRVVGKCDGKFLIASCSDGRQRMRWSHKECDALELVSWLFFFCQMGAVPGLGIIIDEQMRKGTEL